MTSLFSSMHAGRDRIRAFEALQREADKIGNDVPLDCIENPMLREMIERRRTQVIRLLLRETDCTGGSLFGGDHSSDAAAVPSILRK